MALTFDLTQERRPQVGIVALQADESLEPDLRRLLPAEVEYYISRVPSDTSVSRETLLAMRDKIAAAASLFPRGARLAAVAYGCTSASAEIGPDRVAELVKHGVDTRHVTEPMSALLEACAHLGVRKIGMISPYVEAVSQNLILSLTEQGLEIVSFESFEVAEEHKVVRIAPNSIKDAAVEMGNRSDCDAIFLSCTNLRTLDIIDGIEREIGKPVLSSNQVLAWHLGQLAGFHKPSPGFGRLFSQN